ncbi:MAG: sulfotransferase family 2 domain-containing protein, partial [Pseudomonadota bacterium]
MIISHQYKFIFIKTRKTAGTSIEAFLSQCCGPDDIFTPITPSVASHQPRNHAGFYNHISGHEVRARLGCEQWESYFKFCVERNPWDKVLSFYHFVRVFWYAGDLSLAEFLETKYFRVDWPLYTDPFAPGQLLVDKVLRYETLADDLAQ